DKVYWLGANDRRTSFFENMWPLPDGVSYNSYLIVDEKIALVDTIEYGSSDDYLDKIEKIIDGRSIDYLIINHMEPDHSGAIKTIVNKYPDIKLVGNLKTFKIVESYFGYKDNWYQVEDGDILELGYHKLKFIMTPWVHWPETMITYLQEDKILFSCDFFGSHLATNETFVTDENKILEDAKRYYAEIMMPFRAIIRKNIEKLSDLDIKMIAPSHGPVYKNPSAIIDSYKEWISEEVKNEVVIPYVSMHESTLIMVEYLVNELIKKGIDVKPFNLPKTDIGELAMSLVDAATVIVASPTVLAGAHPAAVYATFLTNALRPKTKFVGIIGSYGWGGKMVEQLSGLLGNLKVEIIDPVLVKGRPNEDDFDALDKLVEQVVENHKTIK
ncbi:MAG: FprA family A-type flavoprotein, partial [Candidatus Delongbacteria bacterium]|nr:FprA family A-type flavoprotein [Candidatus Delongbacteria bacterium]